MTAVLSSFPKVVFMSGYNVQSFKKKCAEQTLDTSEQSTPDTLWYSPEEDLIWKSWGKARTVYLNIVKEVYHKGREGVNNSIFWTNEYLYGKHMKS